MDAERREKHPYHMVEEIQLQPEAIARSLRIVAEQGAEVRHALGRARRVFLTGAGTSYHAAQVGAWMLRSFTRGRIDARAVEAFELATYLPGLRPDDLVIAFSHSGTSVTTNAALERAQRAGLESVLITGFPQRAGAARYVLPTGHPEERSWAHTAGYTSALTSIAALANDLADPAERLDLNPLPELVRDVLGLEEMAHRLAGSTLLVERFQQEIRIFITGAGPNVATANEGALKLLETSYTPALAFELEEMLHGPLAAVMPDSLVILLAPPGRSVERAAELVAALAELSVTPVVLCGEQNEAAFPEAHRLVLPDLPEVISPIPYVVPLQFFSYYLAVGEGLNPDLIHRDQEPYQRARAAYR